jgi:hypothetical protein
VSIDNIARIARGLRIEPWKCSGTTDLSPARSKDARAAGGDARACEIQAPRRGRYLLVNYFPKNFSEVWASIRDSSKQYLSSCFSLQTLM